MHTRKEWNEPVQTAVSCKLFSKGWLSFRNANPVFKGAPKSRFWCEIFIISKVAHKKVLTWQSQTCLLLASAQFKHPVAIVKKFPSPKPWRPNVFYIPVNRPLFLQLPLPQHHFWVCKGSSELALVVVAVAFVCWFFPPQGTYFLIMGKDRYLTLWEPQCRYSRQLGRAFWGRRRNWINGRAPFMKTHMRFSLTPTSSPVSRSIDSSCIPRSVWVKGCCYPIHRSPNSDNFLSIPCFPISPFLSQHHCSAVPSLSKLPLMSRQSQCL